MRVLDVLDCAQYGVYNFFWLMYLLFVIVYPPVFYLILNLVPFRFIQVDTLKIIDPLVCLICRMVLVVLER